MERERAEMTKDDGKEHEADMEGDGPRVPRKSKFVSNPLLSLSAKFFFGKQFVSGERSFKVMKGFLGPIHQNCSKVD